MSGRAASMHRRVLPRGVPTPLLDIATCCAPASHRARGNPDSLALWERDWGLRVNHSPITQAHFVSVVCRPTSWVFIITWRGRVGAAGPKSQRLQLPLLSEALLAIALPRLQTPGGMAFSPRVICIEASIFWRFPLSPESRARASRSPGYLCGQTLDFQWVCAKQIPIFSAESLVKAKRIAYPSCFAKEDQHSFRHLHLFRILEQN